MSRIRVPYRPLLRLLDFALRLRFFSVIAGLFPDTALASVSRAGAVSGAGGNTAPIVRLWRAKWEEFVPFLAFPPEVRRVVYTTNLIESINARLRTVVRNRGQFPSEQAALKVLYLAVRNLEKFHSPTVGTRSAGWSRGAKTETTRTSTAIDGATRTVTVQSETVVDSVRPSRATRRARVPPHPASPLKRSESAPRPASAA